MKRLIVTTLLLAAVLATGQRTFAQSKDLGGAWVFDAARSSPKDGPAAAVITLTATEFTVRLGPEGAPPMTFKLDGTETPMARGGGKMSAKWEGHKVVASVVGPKGSRDTIRFSREGEMLLMEGQSDDHGPVKFYFKKASPKL